MTRRINRQLWELNNRYRAFWGTPSLPEPEEGFAAELPPPYADLLTVVEHWFREATTGQPHRSRQPKIPREREIKRIAHLIYEWEEQARYSGDPLRAVALEKVHRFQRSIAEMRKALSQILDLALPTAASGDPAVRRLIDLWNAAILAEPYIGPTPKQGRQIVTWHIMARALAPLVSAALVSAGHQHPSLNPDGPAIKVICRALEHLDGIEHPRTAVASYLKRWQKGSQKNLVF